MGERDRLTHRQRERAGEKKERTRQVEPKSEKSGGFDRRKALSDVKELKKELGDKVDNFVPELDRLSDLLMRMKKKDGDPVELHAEFQTVLQETREKAAGVEKQPVKGKKEDKGVDVAERLASVVGLDKDSVNSAEIEKRRVEAREKWKEEAWDKKEGVFTLPDGSKIELRGGGPLGYCAARFGPGKGKDWFDGTVNFIYKYRQRDRAGNLEEGFGTERARIRILFRGAQAEKFEVNKKIGEKELGAKSGKGLAELKQMLLDARRFVGEEVEREFGSGKPTEKRDQLAEALRKSGVHLPRVGRSISPPAPDVEDVVVDQEKAPTPAQETHERAKGEPLVKKEEVKECLKYLWVRRELRKRWEDKSARAEWLQKNSLDEMGLSRALVEQIKNDFGLEPILTVDYDGAQFGQRKKPAPVFGTEKIIGDNIGNKAEEKVVVDDEEGIADLTEAEKEVARQKWFKPVEKKKKEPIGEPSASMVEKREMTAPIEKKEDKEERKNIERYRYLATRKDLDRPETWTDAIKRVMVVLAAESGGVIKEKGVENNGLVKLRDSELPTLIISDIHARRQSLLSILEKKTDNSGRTIFDYLKEGKINVVCLGDGMHSEKRGKERWEKAMQEGFSIRKSAGADGEEEIFMSAKADNMEMNAEMVESLNTMRMIMDLKIAFSDNFHFLRGNHDDILGDDIALFKKYAEESLMTLEWAKKNMGDDFVSDYARFEHSLPLALNGKYFVASHGGPSEPFTAAQIKAKEHATMKGMTFTANGDIVADKGKLEKMLAELLPDCEPDERKWFIGHRAVSGSRVVQHLGSSKEWSPFYQLNNPEQLSFAMFDPKEKDVNKMKGDFVPEEPTLGFVEDKKLFAKK